jgi:chitodextrinase
MGPTLALATSGEPTLASATSGNDTKRPSPPRNLQLTAATETSLSLSWGASRDNVGVAGYELFVDGTPAGQTTSTSYTLTGLACSRSYDIRVGAYDAAGNVSNLAAVSASTKPCPAAAAPPPPSPAPSTTVAPASGVLFGAHVENRSPSTVASFESGIAGRRLAVDHGFYSYTNRLYDTATQDDLSNGRIPFITTFGWSGFPGLDAINAGSEDTSIHALAAEAKKIGRPFYLRIMHEMNLYKAPYNMSRTDPRTGSSNTTGEYITAFRRIVSIFRQDGATNAKFVWCPTWQDNPSTAENHFTNYYPGDDIVDFVCVDAYNRYTQWWRDLKYEITASVYPVYSGRKPIIVGESSSIEDPAVAGRKAGWISQVQADLKTLPQVKVFLWFHQSPSGGDEDWRVNTSSSATSAYRQMGADPYYNP